MSSADSQPSAIRPPLSFEQFFAAHFAAAYQEQLAEERQWQEEAFAECTHTVCGMEVRGMTVDDYLILHGCENAFVAGGLITGETIAQFLAVLVEPAPRGWWARRQFFRAVARHPYARAVEQIRAYVRRMFISSDIAITPALSSIENRESKIENPESAPALCTHFIAPLLVSLAAELHWSERDLRAMRLDKLFQYRRAIAYRNGTATAYPAADRLQSEALQAYGRYTATGELPSLSSQPSTLN